MLITVLDRAVVNIVLYRFDAETGDESEKLNEDPSTTSFLSQLATWHKEELDEKAFVA